MLKGITDTGDACKLRVCLCTLAGRLLSPACSGMFPTGAKPAGQIDCRSIFIMRISAMTMTTRVEKDFIAAYKAKDEVRVAVLRLLKSAFKNRQVELMHPLSDDEALDVIQKQSKQRRDSIEQYTAAGRKDLADREAAELEILSSYLPEPLTPEELGAAIEAAIAETGVSSMAGMGKVMSAVLAACKGRVDGKTASAAVRARLQKNG